MGSPYPVGHPSYRRFSPPSHSISKGKHKQTSDIPTSKMKENRPFLKLKNNTGCCQNHLCQNQSLYCEKNLCFVNLTVQLLDSINIFQDFFTSNDWINLSEKQTHGKILTELEFIFSSKRKVATSAGTLRHLVANAAENPEIGNGQMKDAAEFLGLMLTEIEKEFIYLGVSNPITDSFKLL